MEGGAAANERVKKNPGEPSFAGVVRQSWCHWRGRLVKLLYVPRLARIERQIEFRTFAVNGRPVSRCGHRRPLASGDRWVETGLIPKAARPINADSFQPRPTARLYIVAAAAADVTRSRRKGSGFGVEGDV